MKSLLFAICLGMITISTRAQLTCPDFQIDDINGQQWHFYDVLDDGKVAYFFFFGTNTQAAWDYHNSGVLNNLYDAEGSNGTDKAIVFAFTGSDAWGVTNEDPDVTLGNWQAGISYPIFCRPFDDGTGPYPIDNFMNGVATLFDLNQAQGRFSVFRICPDRSITRYAVAPTAEQMAADLSLCTIASQPRDAKLTSVSFDTQPNCPNETRPISVRLTNLGTDTLTTCTIRREYNEHWPHTFQWSGSLPTYHSEVVTLEDIYLWGDTARIQIIAQNPNGSPDLHNANDTIQYALKPSAHWTDDEIRVEIQTDGYGPTLWWDITGSDGVKIDSGGNRWVYLLNAEGAPGGYGYPDNFHFEKTIPLTGEGLDCATITVLSGLGYGVCCDYGMGYVRFWQGDDLVYEYTDFGRRAYDKFHVAWVNTEETTAVRGLTAFPNPTNGNITVSFSLEKTTLLDVQVYNLMGQRVQAVPLANYPMGKQEVVINTSTLPDGIYWLSLRDAAGGVQSVRFVVAR